MVNSSWKSKLLYLPIIEAFKVPNLFFVASYFSLGSTGLSLKPENSFENSLDSTLFFKSVIVYLTSTLLLFFVIDFKLKL